MFSSFFFLRMLQPFQVENTNLIWGTGELQQYADGEGIVSLKPYASFPTYRFWLSNRQKLSKSITLPVSLFYLRTENLGVNVMLLSCNRLQFLRSVCAGFGRLRPPWKRIILCKNFKRGKSRLIASLGFENRPRINGCELSLVNT